MQTIINGASEKMDKAIVSLKHSLATIRTGRANPTMLDNICIDYYGSPTPVNQVGSVKVNEGTQLVIKPYEASILKDIEKAINASDLGLVPQNDGTVIRLNVPGLTEERRKELSKNAHKMGEESKVAIRNIRRDANDLVKKNKELTEDMKKQAQEKIQKTTDEYVKKIDAVIEEKTKEIMTI